MDHPTLILGELRGFKEEALRRLDGLEKATELLLRAEAVRKGRAAAYSVMGGLAGSIITWIVTYFAN